MIFLAYSGSYLSTINLYLMKRHYAYMANFLTHPAFTCLSKSKATAKSIKFQMLFNVDDRKEDCASY